MKVLWVCGIVPESPARMRPLPPLDSGAPHSNIFRLVEGAAIRENNHGIEILAVSACSQPQAGELAETWPDSRLKGSYQQVIVSDGVRRWSRRLLDVSPRSSSVLLRAVNAFSILGWYYLRGIRRLAACYQPDVVVLDDGPQFIKGLASMIGPDRTAFYCRGDMGSSRRYLHVPRAVIVTNSRLGNWVREINPGVRHTFVVPNSLPAEALEPRHDRRAATLTETEPVVLFVGRIVPEKGLQHLIQAFPRVLKAVPGAKLVIAGAGASADDGRLAGTAFEQELVAMASRLLPAGAVEWLGWVPGSRLQKIYHQASIAVFPSVCVEGFGMVALEAMAAGVPVVASRTPGFEAQLNGGGGVLVDEPSDHQKLGEAVSWVLRDPAVHLRLSEEGQSRATDYTVENSVRSLVSALRGCCHAVEPRDQL